MAAMATLMSCGQQHAASQGNSEILVTVGDSSLTVSDVVRRIPSGLSEEDSLHLFGRIVDEWVRDLILSDYAEKNISDMEKIDRMVEAYRNDLIVNSYLQSMSEGARKEIPESRIRDYFEANRHNMLLDQPLVKGIFLKVAESNENLPSLRRWFQQFDERSIDEIEKSGLRRALQYKYFKDEWVEWNGISEQIPYRFFDADAFLRSTKFFETADNGSVYLLRISDYVPSESEMPYEFAKNKISDMLQALDVDKYRRNLVSDIYRRMIGEGVLKPGLYDPVSGRMVGQQSANIRQDNNKKNTDK